MPADLPIMTIAIIIVTVICSLLGFNDYSIIERYRFHIYAIRQHNSYIQLLSSGFLHADFGHLFFNMFSFYSFAASIELSAYYGMEYILLIYFSSMIGGNLLSLLFHKKEPHYSAVGASGAVCGIIFASTFMLPGGKIILFMIPYPIPAYVYAVLFVLISIFGIHAQRDNIGHEAHLGGALTGMIIVLLMFPRLVFYNLALFLTIMIIAAGFILLTLLKPEIVSAANNYIRSLFSKKD